MVFNRLKSNEFSSLTGYGDRFLTLVSNAEEGYRLPSIKVLKESVVTNDLYSRKGQQIKRFLILLENIGKMSYWIMKRISRKHKLNILFSNPLQVSGHQSPLRIVKDTSIH